jgi:hypothetical protein
VNAVVIPAGIESGRHFHDEQEELYFVAACLRTTTARARQIAS